MVARGELSERPGATLQLCFCDRLGRIRRHLEQERVGVPEEHRPAEVSKAVEHLSRLRPALRDVAEAHDLLDAESLQHRYDSGEGDIVAVDVRDERERHRDYDKPS